MEGIENGHAKIRPDIFVGVTENIEFEVETVLAEVFEIDERRRLHHDVGIILRDLEQDGLCLPRIRATSHGHRDRYAADVVTKGPVFHLFGDEMGIRNENIGSVERLDLSGADADLAHVSFLAGYTHEVANLDRSLGQEDQA